jgi:hypothetical protein
VKTNWAYGGKRVLWADRFLVVAFLPRGRRVRCLFIYSSASLSHSSFCQSPRAPCSD